MSPPVSAARGQCGDHDQQLGPKTGLGDSHLHLAQFDQLRQLLVSNVVHPLRLVRPRPHDDMIARSQPLAAAKVGRPSLMQTGHEIHPRRQQQADHEVRAKITVGQQDVARVQSFERLAQQGVSPVSLPE